MTALRLAMAALLLSAGAATAQPIIGDEWDYERNYDAFDDTLSTRATTEQADELYPIGIDIACVAFEGFRASVTFPEYIAKAGTNVRYRVDDGELVQETWTASQTDRSTLYAPHPELFAWRLIKGGTLLIEAQKDRGDPVRIAFKTSHGDREIYKVMRDCRMYQGRLFDDLPFIGRGLGAAIDPPKPDGPPEDAPVSQ